MEIARLGWENQSTTSSSAAGNQTPTAVPQKRDRITFTNRNERSQGLIILILYRQERRGSDKLFNKILIYDFLIILKSVFLYIIIIFVVVKI